MKSFFVLLSLLAAHLCWSQSTLQGNLVGGYQQSSTITYSTEWTIGEVINESFTINDWVVSSGLTGSHEIVTSTSGEPESTALQSFPNPFANTLTIESAETDLLLSTFEFHDAIGKQVNVPIVHTEETRITFSTENLSSGLYVITIRPHHQGIIKNLKVIRK